VADSHAVVWYLLDDDRKWLSPKASSALAEAETDGGIAVSVVSLADLWYVTQTTAAITPATLEAVRGLLTDPESALAPVPVTVKVAAAYETIPLQKMRDPWDRFIVATAKVRNAPLVTADSKIAALGLVEVLW
jgi:PIN domain nuclease of toxin-antitoxin system